MSLTDDEKKIRATGVGASEVATLVGLNPYETPMALWLKKRGLVEDAAGEAAEWGNLLEPVVAQKWAAMHQMEIVKGTSIRHPGYSHVLATPDYLTERGVLEIKAPGLRQAKMWGQGGDEIPEAYLVQVQIQLAVTLRPVWDLAALIGGQDYREFEGEEDKELQSGLCDAIERFWADHVEADIPPPVDASEATRRWLTSKFPQAIGTTREASSQEAKLMQEYHLIRAQIRELEGKKAATAALLCNSIGDAKTILWGTSKATWGNRKGFTRPAVEIAPGRQLRVSIGDDDE